MLQLEVVNRCLGTMGEAPLAGLDDTHPYLGAALDLLDQTNRQVQSPGRWFNSETLRLVPDPLTKSLNLPGDCLEVNTEDANIVQRGLRLYNLDGGTYEFDKPLTVRVIRLVAFDELPEVVAAAIATKTVVRFQMEYDGDSTKTAALSRLAAEAWAEFGGAEVRNRNVNLIDKHPALARIIRLSRKWGARS